MKGKKRLNKLKDPYRLVLLREDTLEEVGSYRLSFLNIYIAVSTILVLLAVIVACLIIFTPIKRMIPGYGDVTESMEYITLYNRVQKLETMIKAQRTYTDHFKKLLTNHVDSSATDAASSHDPAISMSQPMQHSEDFTFAFEDDHEEPIPAAMDGGSSIQDTVLVVNRLHSPNLVEYMFFVSPLKGTISAGFDGERGHYGTDILAPKNTPIKSIMDGHVITSDWTLETGNTIGIQHASNIVSFYKHNSINLKKLGSFVEAGEAVAIIGNTGSISSGPHLHFELWIDGKPVDPTRFIDFD